MKSIDPIVVAEEKTRLWETAGVMNQGVKAANALIWFAEYAVDESSLRLSADVVAGATPNADIAKDYLAQAVRSLGRQVLDTAIAQAQHDFQIATQTRSKGVSK